MKQQIKVGICVAYDWYFLAQSIPLIYDSADIICLAIDKDRISWAGNPFSFDESGFRDLIKRLDPNKKINIYEDDFHLSHLSAIDNDTRQRNLLAQYMGPGGWHIQLDSDEYFLGFNKFASWLKKQYFNRSVNIRCQYIMLFKQLDSGFLVINNNDYFKLDGNPVATNDPAYEYARVNRWFNIYAPFYILHQSWARPEREITEKVYNWGHTDDFDKEQYLRFWLNLNKNNYHCAKNFNPLHPIKWPYLEYVPAKNVLELMNYYNDNPPFMPSKFRFGIQNSIWASRMRKVVAMIVQRS
ncbi:hypothetical protein SAMN00120144_0943 [Hymenobacter roseosalivarius DSM 11622]|uniref:Glycosyltransferase n=1 Tax=Hymenobacter roseosalivarius DSM 11622 TaxID=645990 RepID=A0A1W1V7X9_9BACT|nr:hypothetical protein [Hymenobacter roseosalivarius]SMB89529.1 hypothetical protein SAMN00120144_0943 [Hymenobacter roseosalivarius DSM 11622]